MADLLTKLKTLFMKTESAEGTANAPGAGDAIYCSGIEVEEDLAINEREYQGTPGARAPVPGAQNGASLSFTTELKGNGTTTIPEIDELLTGCFGQVVAADLDTTISGTAGSSSVWDILAATNGTVGSMVMLETATADTYECAGPIKVANTAPTPDALTVALAAVNGGYATNGKKVKEMRTWSPLLPPTAVNSLTADIFYNADAGAGQRERLVGLRGSWKMDSPRAGAIPSWAFSFKGWNTTRTVAGTRPTPTYDSASPKAGVASIYRVDGVYTNMFDVSVDLGAEVGMKMSQNSTLGVYGTPHVKYRPSGSFKIHPAHSSVAHFTDWEAGTTHSLLFQVGNALYGTWAIFVPRASWTKVTRPDDGGVQALEIQWTAVEQNDALATSATLDASIYLGLG